MRLVRAAANRDDRNNIHPDSVRPVAVTSNWALLHDPAGRFSWLKTGCLALLLWPAAVLFWRASQGALGSRPITQAIHETGDLAIEVLLVSLAVTPMRAIFGWGRVLILRRMIGVTAALYGVVHLVMYCLDQKFAIWPIVSEIALRFYLTIGLVVLLGLLVLMVTSTDRWQRRLRQRWTALHRAVYPLTALALLHYTLQAKADKWWPMVYIGGFVWLMLWRRLPRRGQMPPWPLLPLALAAALTTGGLEYAWFALATRIPAQRVLLANFTLGTSMRPAQLVLLAGLAVAVAALLRRAARYVPFGR